jgi:YggT family protein
MMTLYRIIDTVFWLLDLAILLRVLFSWINADPYNPLVRFIYQVTEPLLAPLRRFIPPFGSLDVTPVVALLILDLARRFLVTLIFR